MNSRRIAYLASIFALAHTAQAQESSTPPQTPSASGPAAGAAQQAGDVQSFKRVDKSTPVYVPPSAQATVAPTGSGTQRTSAPGTQPQKGVVFEDVLISSATAQPGAGANAIQSPRDPASGQATGKSAPPGSDPKGFSWGASQGGGNMATAGSATGAGATGAATAGSSQRTHQPRPKRAPRAKRQHKPI